MVNDREAVAVRALTLSGRTTFVLRVADGEVGKLIGGQGRTARSLRHILACIGRGNGENFFLDLDGIDLNHQQ